MTDGAIVVRSSQGSDDKVSLDVQRERTLQLAKEHGVDDPDIIDFGIHTGWSLFTRGVEAEDEKRIDQNPKMQQLLDDLRAGEYDKLFAYDDTRPARDRFLVVVEHACIEGGCEMVFYEDADTSSLMFWIKRFVETHAKLKEMRATLEALAHRDENDYWQGRPRWGTRFDDDGQYLEPGEDFEEALTAIRLREEHGASYSDIIEATAVTSTGTLRSILDNASWYMDLADRHGVEVPELPPVAVDD